MEEMETTINREHEIAQTREELGETFKGEIQAATQKGTDHAGGVMIMIHVDADVEDQVMIGIMTHGGGTEGMVEAIEAVAIVVVRTLKDGIKDAVAAQPEVNCSNLRSRNHQSSSFHQDAARV
jgi:hypothetical protein